MSRKHVLTCSTAGLLATFLLGATALAEPLPARSPARPMPAYVHERVRDRARTEGQARVIVIMGDPGLPRAWARDWREREPAIRELGARVRRDAPRFQVHRQYQIFPFLAGTADNQALRELAASPLVEAVVPDRRLVASLSESGPLIGQPYAETTKGYDGSGVGIAIIDSGIDATHPDLDEGKVVAGENFILGADPNDYDDDNGHGTYVAGIAAGTGGTYRGIAPGAHLLALKALDADGIGYASDIILAIHWCILNQSDYNIKVINLSLGDGAEWRDPAECDTDVEGIAISDAVDAGIVVVAAAGNEEYTQGVSIPACASDAIAVGASWDSGPSVDTPAYFSNRGELLDVFAPGIWIWSTRVGGSYEEGAGTSAATPHVAGAAAVLAQAGITDPDAIRYQLRRTGVQILDPASAVAAPRIDLERALDDEPTSGPDLVVTAVGADLSEALVGAALDLSITVENQGTSGSSACKALIGMSLNAVPSPQDLLVTTVDVPALVAGETWSDSSVAGSVPGGQPGDYWLTAFADSDYSVSEKDEVNNGLKASLFTMQALSSFVQSNDIPASMLKGQTYRISVEMWNDGSAPWASGEGYALAATSPEGTSRWGVTSVPLPAGTVAAGANVTFSFDVTAPAELGLYPCHWQMARGGQYFGEIATGATKVRLLDDPEWGQYVPSVDGEWVAFEDYSVVPGYAAAVRAQNVGSPWPITLPDDVLFELTYDPVWGDMPQPPHEYVFVSLHWFPDVSYPWVAWMTDDFPDGDPVSPATFWYFQVVAQNVANLSTLPLRLTYQDKDTLFPAIDGNLVVWEDYRNDPDGTWGFNFLDDNPDIYICDISDVSGPDDYFPPVYPLCTAPGPQFAPRISYPYVVWEDWRDLGGMQSDLYVYDLSVDSDGDGTPNWKEALKPSPDPAEIQLTDTYWPEEFPDVDGTSVVYMDLGRDTGSGWMIDIYLTDIESPTAVAVATEPPTFRWHPRVSGTKVTWEDWGQGQPDIHWVDLETGAGGPIAASGAREEWPAVSGDRAVYQKHRDTIMLNVEGELVAWQVYNIWVQEMLQDGSVGVHTFIDVTPSFWAWRHIEATVAAGVVQGYADGTYQPSWPVTRDQMAVYISRALAGGDEYVPEFTATPTFPDVPEGFWALDYVEYAVAQNVVTGYGDGTYHPEYEVTRDQMAVYVARAMVAPTGEAALADYVPADPRNFPDVPGTFWAYKHIEYCVENGVVQGYLDGNYYPATVVTRDQMAVYVSRAFGYVGD